MYAIRSYYDRAVARGPPSRSVIGVDGRVPEIDRITSYNVCYTKLLRYEGIDFIDTEKEMAQTAISKAIENIADILARTNARSLLLTMWLESHSRNNFV